MSLRKEPIPSGPPRIAPSERPRQRQCLRCRAAFPSEGFGERICRQCKGTNAWRNPALVRKKTSPG